MDNSAVTTQTVTSTVTTTVNSIVYDYNVYHVFLQPMINNLLNWEFYSFKKNGNNQLKLRDILHKISKIPILQYIISYIKKSHQNDPYRTLIELLLIIVGIIYINKKNYNSSSNNNGGNGKNKNNNNASGRLDLSEKEENQLLAEWQPKPLIDQLDPNYNHWKLDCVPVLLKKQQQQKGNSHNYRDVKYKDITYKNVINASNLNFLNLQNSNIVKDSIKKTLKKYGVGACGPAGFYGNEDVHYNLEYELAEFFGTENCVLYGQDFCVAASVLSTFNKRGDIIVADNMCNVSIQNALQLSRASIYYYQHNDMKSLNDILLKIDTEEQNEPQLHRKFIVTEGIFQSNGDLCLLPDLITLKHKYKFRLFIDETLSIGTLGKTGRGIVEHFGFPNRCNDIVDITIGSLATSFGSSGGFCLGDNTLSFFQRIGSNAYCFSASLPPYACVAASEVLKILDHHEDNDEDEGVITKLHSNTKLLFNGLLDKLSNKHDEEHLENKFIITSSSESPMIIIKLDAQARLDNFQSSMQSIYDSLNKQQNILHSSNIKINEFNNEEIFLTEIIEKLITSHGILVSLTPHALRHESLPILPSLMITSNAAYSTDDITKICDSVSQVLWEFSKKLSSST